MHERDLLKMKANRSNYSNDWRIFKTLRNQVNYEIKQAKESYYKDALNTNKGNSRETWRIINELRSKTPKCSSIKEIIYITVHLLLTRHSTKMRCPPTNKTFGVSGYMHK
jgi:hypothetical protein